MSEKNLERHIKIYPAFDRRHSDPSKNYGIHGTDLFMAVKGKMGSYQFKLFMPYHLPGSLSDNKGRPDFIVHKDHSGKIHFEEGNRCMPADVGYHAKEPQYENHTKMDDDCQWTNGPCYYDGSTGYATNVMGMMVKGGSDAVFEHLEELYNDKFYGDGS